MKTLTADLSFTIPAGGFIPFWAAGEVRGAEEEIRRLTEEGIRKMPGTLVIKENRHRVIFRAKLPFVKAPVLVKSFRYPSFRRRLKALFAPYAVQELKHAAMALERGIPVPMPLFLVQRRRGAAVTESLLGYRYLEGSPLLAYFFVKGALPYVKRLQLVRSAGRFTAFLHNCGVIHRDYHAGNLLVLKDETVALIDLYPVKFVKELRERDRIEGLASLIASLAPVVGRAGIDELLDGYREKSTVYLGMEAEDRAMKRQEALRGRHEASRARRCMKNSTEFYQARVFNARIAARREIPVDEIRSLLKTLDQKYKNHPERALKNAPESVIFKLESMEGSLCVKWYRKRGRMDRVKELLRGGRALRAWKAGNGLLARGIPVARPLAMARTARGGFLFMELAEGAELDRMLSRMVKVGGTENWRMLCRLADTVGAFFGTLHRKGVFHADLKACNIMVREEGNKFLMKLLDYDNVRFHGNLSMKKALKNLVQLNLSIPVEISRSLRLRFLKAYKGNFPGAPRARELFKEVWEASRGKNIVYVTNEGDRRTSWRS